MYQIIDIKTGEFIPINNLKQPQQFETEKEALAQLRADIKKINGSTKAFARSYGLPVTPKDLLDIKNYCIILVTATTVE